MRRIQILIVVVAALFVLGPREATSQERMPTVPRKQIPPASVFSPGESERLSPC